MFILARAVVLPGDRAFVLYAAARGDRAAAH
jgi:hypothetical protein